MENHLERLLMDVKESLERQIADGFADMRTRFDDQAARLDRHAGLWRAGTVWSSRMDAWAEKIDKALDAKDQQIAELRERLTRIERKLDHGPQPSA